MKSKEGPGIPNDTIEVLPKSGEKRYENQASMTAKMLHELQTATTLFNLAIVCVTLQLVEEKLYGRIFFEYYLLDFLDLLFSAQRHKNLA